MHIILHTAAKRGRKKTKLNIFAALSANKHVTKLATKFDYAR